MNIFNFTEQDFLNYQPKKNKVRYSRINELFKKRKLSFGKKKEDIDEEILYLLLKIYYISIKKRYYSYDHNDILTIFIDAYLDSLKDFDEKSGNFVSFFKVVLHRRSVDKLNTKNAKKDRITQPLNITFENDDNNNEIEMNIGIEDAYKNEPFELFWDMFEIEYYKNLFLENLNPSQQYIVKEMIFNGKSYNEIDGLKPKQVDNALQILKHKNEYVRAYLSQKGHLTKLKKKNAKRRLDRKIKLKNSKNN